MKTYHRPTVADQPMPQPIKVVIIVVAAIFLLILGMRVLGVDIKGL